MLLFCIKSNNSDLSKESYSFLFSCNTSNAGTIKIDFSPYFNFYVDLALNNMNFTKLYKLFLSLDDEAKKNIFNINRKINGTLNFSTDKIYCRKVCNCKFNTITMLQMEAKILFFIVLYF